MKRSPVLLFLCLLLQYGCIKKDAKITFKGNEYKKEAFDSIKQIKIDVTSLKTIDLRNVFRRHFLSSTSDETFDFTSLIDHYELVFLETTDSSIIGEVSKVIRNNGLIFVLDSRKANSLFLFDMKGKFLRTIGRRGNGPGEYREATDFEYDPTKGFVYLYDQFKSQINTFDTSGTFLGNRKLPFRCINFVKVGDEYVYQNLLSNDHINQVQNSSLSVGTANKSITKVGLPMLKYNFLSDRISKINDSTARYSIPYNDTIYHYEKGGLTAKYTLLFPESTKLPKDFKKRTGPDYERFRNLFPKKRYTYYESGCWESSNYLIINISYNTFNYTLYYNKYNNMLTYGAKSVNSRDRLEKLLIMSDPISSYDDEFIVPVYFPWYISDINAFLSDRPKEEKRHLYMKYPLLTKWDADKNPILCFIKYK